MHELFQKTLKSGVGLVVDPMHDTECVSINAGFFVGSAHETKEQHGIAHFLEHMMFKGTHDKGFIQILHQIEELGGHINARTDWDTTSFQINVLKENMDAALMLLGKMLTDTQFSTEAMELEKKIVVEELNGRGGAFGILEEGFYDAAYGDHPLSRPTGGTEVSVSAFTPEMVGNFKDQHYVAGNFAIAIAGDVDPEIATQSISNHFADLPLGQRSKTKDIKYYGGEVQFPCPCDRGMVLLGFPVTSYGGDNYAACDLLVDILGGGPSSRLFQELRERRGLAYDVSCYTQVHAKHQFLIMNAVGQAKNTKEIFQVMCEEFSGIIGSVTEREFERTKFGAISHLRMQRDYLTVRASDAILDYGELGRVRSLEDRIRDIEQTTLPVFQKNVGYILAQQPTLGVHGTFREMPKLTDYF